eukprot:scaffold323405_cov12-Tisochrysis_lutea.AAC.1
MSSTCFRQEECLTHMVRQASSGTPMSRFPSPSFLQASIPTMGMGTVAAQDVHSSAHFASNGLNRL